MTNHGMSGVCNMSFGLWCAGVELGGSGRRRDEGQVGTCRADGLGAVKDGGVTRRVARDAYGVRYSRTV